MEPDHMASSAVFLLCSSSQKTLLPSYLGALINLIPAVYLWRKECFRMLIVIEEGSGALLNPIRGRFRLIFPDRSKSLALIPLFQCLLPSFLQRVLCKCLQFEHDLLIHVAQSHTEYLEKFCTEFKHRSVRKHPPFWSLILNSAPLKKVVGFMFVCLFVCFLKFLTGTSAPGSVPFPLRVAAGGDFPPLPLQQATKHGFTLQEYGRFSLFSTCACWLWCHFPC